MRFSLQRENVTFKYTVILIVCAAGGGYGGWDEGRNECANDRTFRCTFFRPPVFFFPVFRVQFQISVMKKSCSPHLYISRPAGHTLFVIFIYFLHS